MSHTYSGTTFAALIPGGLPTLTQGAGQSPPFAPERLYTVEEAAEYLHIGDRTVYKFIAEGRLIASWVGRSHLITQSNLVAFVKGAEQDYSKPTSPEIL